MRNIAVGVAVDLDDKSPYSASIRFCAPGEADAGDREVLWAMMLCVTHSGKISELNGWARDAITAEAGGINCVDGWTPSEERWPGSRLKVSKIRAAVIAHRSSSRRTSSTASASRGGMLTRSTTAGGRRWLFLKPDDWNRHVQYAWRFDPCELVPQGAAKPPPQAPRVDDVDPCVTDDEYDHTADFL